MAPALLGYLNDKKDDIYDLLEKTPHTATIIEAMVGPEATRRGQFKIEPQSQHLAPLEPSLLSSFYHDYTTGEWTKETPVPRGGQRRRRHVVRKRNKVDATQVVRDLLEAGGIDNVVHAVLGYHYFAPGSTMRT